MKKSDLSAGLKHQINGIILSDKFQKESYKQMADFTRLYSLFKPNFYKLNLLPDQAKRLFKGQVIIKGRIAPHQTELRLHAKALNVSKAIINGTVCSFRIEPKSDELNISLPKNVKKLDLIVKIIFNGRITDSLCGLYPCFGRDGKIILTTQFESHYAREVFPCIDEPEAKAVFSLCLTTPAGETVLSNTLPKTTKKAGSLITTVFENTPKMSTYLLAFVIGKLDKIESTTKDNILVRAWATPDQAKFMSFALDVAIKSLEFFNDYFEIPYPLKKCDIVAVPDFAAGAMENWGLITFRETAMLVDPANTSLDSKQHVAERVAHELAHQWFGNLVTMKWWNDLWLNEGFASWIEYLAIDKIFPSWHMWTQFIINEQDAALRQDALKNSHPVVVRIDHPEEIPSVFDNISYAKGASVIHMLHQYLGSNNFRLGLVHYLNKNRFGNAETTDLWMALEEVSHKPVRTFMSAWTTQTGYPVVTLRPDKKKLDISQQRFFINGSKSKTVAVWPIPLLAPQINTAIFETSQASLKLPSDLSHFIVNQGQSGFYITKYWPQHYQRLGKLISQRQLPDIDRLRLLNDSLALTIAGHLPLTDFLELLENYANETASPVWDSLVIAFGDIKQAMSEAAWQQLKPLVRNLAAKQSKRLGWQEKNNDNHNDLQLRPLVLGLAASGDDQVVIKEAVRRFQSARTTSDLPPNLRHMILILISRFGSSAEFDKVLGFFKASASPEDKVILARALTNFRQPAEYHKAICLIRSKQVRSQDIIYWLAYGLTNPAAKIEYWQWLKDNWQWLKDNIGNDVSFSQIPMYVARCQNDITFLRQYNDFFKTVHQPGLDRAIKQGRETIRLISAWRKRDEAKLLKWLKASSANRS